MSNKIIKIFELNIGMLLLITAELLLIILSKVMHLKVLHYIRRLIVGYTSTTYFWSAQGSQMRYCGTTAIEGFDDVIIQGNTDPKNPQFSAFYVKKNKVIAVLGIGTDPTVSLSAELLYGIPYSYKLIFRGTIPSCRYSEDRHGYQTDGSPWRRSVVVSTMFIHIYI
jgi:Reductase C-terminal